MLSTTNHTSIDRAERDLSNDVSFIHNTCFGITDRSTHFTVACISGFREIRIMCFFFVGMKYTSIDRAFQVELNEICFEGGTSSGANR